MKVKAVKKVKKRTLIFKDFIWPFVIACVPAVITGIYNEPALSNTVINYLYNYGGSVIVAPPTTPDSVPSPTPALTLAATPPPTSALTLTATPSPTSAPIVANADRNFGKENGGESNWRYAYIHQDAPGELNYGLTYHTEHADGLAPCWGIPGDEVVGGYNIGFLRRDVFHPGKMADVAKIYTVPQDGVATITADGPAYMDNSNENADVSIGIYKNDELLVPLITVKGSGGVEIPSINNVPVVAGDQLIFRVNNGYDLSGGYSSSTDADDDYLHYIPVISITPSASARDFIPEITDKLGMDLSTLEPIPPMDGHTLIIEYWDGVQNNRMTILFTKNPQEFGSYFYGTYWCVPDGHDFRLHIDMLKEKAEQQGYALTIINDTDNPRLSSY